MNRNKKEVLVARRWVCLLIGIGMLLLATAAGAATQTQVKDTSEPDYEHLMIRGDAGSVMEALVKVTLYHGYIIEYYNREYGEFSTALRTDITHTSGFFTSSTEGSQSLYSVRVMPVDEETDLIIFPRGYSTDKGGITSEAKEILSQTKATVEGDTYVSIDKKLADCKYVVNRSVSASPDATYRTLSRGLRSAGLVVGRESIKDGFFLTYYASPKGKKWEIKISCLVFPAGRGKSTLLAGFQVRGLDLPEEKRRGGNERKEAEEKAMKEVRQVVDEMFDNIQSTAEGRSSAASTESTPAESSSTDSAKTQETKTP